MPANKDRKKRSRKAREGNPPPTGDCPFQRQERAIPHPLGIVLFFLPEHFLLLYLGLINCLNYDM
jgi:hypothetical protein